jgi:hypothetical protein
MKQHLSDPQFSILISMVMVKVRLGILQFESKDSFSGSKTAEAVESSRHPHPQRFILSQHLLGRVEGN